ncbi:helix-turn-helix domain-containing protein [Corynebacterium casei]|uniref:helix-turn-helix domain-containing protein n=1 Tax=Corynebacterium casei TaxID=160386 RepID=UPI003F970CAA
MVDSYPTLAQVVGKNVRNLRGAHTLDDVAAYGRKFGATWSSGSVSAIERGNFKVTIETLIFLAFALDQVRGAETVGDGLTIRDLLDSDELIDFGANTIRTTTSDLMKFLSGQPSGHVLNMEHAMDLFSEQLKDWVGEMDEMNLPTNLASFHIGVEEGGTETRTDIRLAKKIGIHPYELRSWAIELWGKNFESRRDEVAGKDATPQKKGRVSRQLLNEIQEAMKGNSNGVD